MREHMNDVNVSDVGFPTHPSISAMRSSHRARIDIWLTILNGDVSLPEPEALEWKPKKCRNSMACNVQRDTCVKVKEDLAKK